VDRSFHFTAGRSEGVGCRRPALGHRSGKQFGDEESDQKESSIDASINQFLFKPENMKFMTKGGAFPGMNASSKTDFNGGGQVQNSDSINSRFTVRVVDALPNGNLLIEGRRSTSFSGEGQTIVLRGTVRRVDVTQDNTVLSHQLADLTLRFDGSGSVNDSQKRGWFGKVWDKVNPM
jgi:flagellar L-ring protein precursor FlgH